MDCFAEQVQGFQECAHGGGELRCCSHADVQQFFRCVAIGRLASLLAIKGLGSTEKIFFGEIARS
jgi:hypothetical protein